MLPVSAMEVLSPVGLAGSRTKTAHPDEKLRQRAPVTGATRHPASRELNYEVEMCHTCTLDRELVGVFDVAAADKDFE